MLKKLINFFDYWYMRYLLVTELYMVEKWERVMFHLVLATFLFILSFFNTTFVLTLVSHFTNALYFKEEPSEASTFHADL